MPMCKCTVQQVNPRLRMALKGRALLADAISVLFPLLVRAFNEIMMYFSRSVLPSLLLAARALHVVAVHVLLSGQSVRCGCVSGWMAVRELLAMKGMRYRRNLVERATAGAR